MSIRTAEIIAVGSELLTPHRLDTNSLFLTGRLNEAGIVLRAKAVVGDDRGDLAVHVRGALGRADLVILTGGLGPTADDVTREVAADVLRLPLDEDAGILARIKERFDRRGMAMPAINRRQALVPRGARVLANPNGTAPGLLLEHERRVVVLLPGPPRELKPMFDADVAPFLAGRAGGRRLRTRVIRTTGRSESQVEEVAEPIYSRFGDDAVEFSTTILATTGQIELHVQAAGAEEDAVTRRLDEAISVLARALGPVVFSTDGRSLEAVVGDALRGRGWTLSAAESCTGGLLLTRLTEIPGSSAYVVGGVVAYANRVKSAMLDVPDDQIAEYGAVSEPVARAMAEGVRGRFGTDVGVGITGIAGPDGGTPEKPVGTVHVAVATAEGTTLRKGVWPGDRDAIRRHATSAALDMVRHACAQNGRRSP